ncbi:MAG: pyruvate formate lyase family protein [Bacillota bacterium]|nr:pyruvate formate lyase family protein [Bacillota bacterium]
MGQTLEVNMTAPLRGSTARVQKLLNELLNKSFSDRSGEWFKDSMFPPVGNEELSVIERRAISFRIMLEAMVSKENSKTTNTYQIKDNELVVGNIPMGSVGFGKVYPQYLTAEERRLISMANRDMQSTFGHNIPDHKKVLEKGINGIIQYCEDKINDTENSSTKNVFRKNKKLEFYNSVIICCQALVRYAEAFADIADENADNETDTKRQSELREIARICRKVPANPAETFYEAIQSVYFVHLALHSTLDYISLGRLDQTLDPYLQKDMSDGKITEGEAQELYECLLIKCAERMNSNPAYFLKQDHSSFGGVFGDSPVFLDQIASANNFLQNIALGGFTKDGKDASNLSTALILRASANLGLPTPIINIRLNKNSSSEIINETVKSLRKGRNGMPVVLNDDIIIDGLSKNGIPIEDCRDYGVDGCWEPILNAKCDWVFGSINFLTILECSLNSGCTFSTDPSLLRGTKTSYVTKNAEEIKNVDELLENARAHIQFFVDKTALQAYSFYSVEGSVNPTPFLSSLLGGCLEKGMDKTWGGSQYHISGLLASALPNCANALANIKKYVFDQKKYTLPEVVDALKNNFSGYEEMKNTFWLDNNKFGNNVNDVDSIMKQLLNFLHEAGLEAKKLGDKTFIIKADEDFEKIKNNRTICHYEGVSMHEKYGQDFNMIFNMGCGTFGQYTFNGKSVGASADGRGRGEPIAANFSPVTGTMKNGIGNAIASLKDLELERFPAGAAIDFCIDDTDGEYDETYYENIVKEFIEDNGSIMTITFANSDELNKVFEICEEVRNNTVSSEALRPYAHMAVRVGGFNAPFITIPREQQLTYLSRVTK